MSNNIQDFFPGAEEVKKFDIQLVDLQEAFKRIELCVQNSKNSYQEHKDLEKSLKLVALVLDSFVQQNKK